MVRISPYSVRMRKTADLKRPSSHQFSVERRCYTKNFDFKSEKISSRNI